MPQFLNEHPAMEFMPRSHRWKKEAIGAMTAGFSGKQERQQNDHTDQIKELHAKIGELTVEKDFLADASRRSGLFADKK